MLSRFFARLAISIAALLIALIAAVTAVGYFAYALDLLLLNWVVPPAAAALTGVFILVVAIVLIQATRIRPRRRPRKDQTIPMPDAWESAAQVGSELGRKIRGLTEAHASGGLLAALVAGFAMGVSPKLRAFLQSLFKS